MTSIFLLSLLYDLVDFVSVLSPRNTLVWQLTNIRQSVESASEVRFPASWIRLVDSRSVAAAVSCPSFKNTSVLIEGPALPRSVFPRDFKYSFSAILPLKTWKSLAVCLMFDPSAKPHPFRRHLYTILSISRSLLQGEISTIVLQKQELVAML